MLCEQLTIRHEDEVCAAAEIASTEPSPSALYFVVADPLVASRAFELLGDTRLYRIAFLMAARARAAA